MRKAMAVGAICLAASFAFAATLLAQSQSKKRAPDAEATQTKTLAAQITPLRMKTGLWQMTMTGKNSQMGTISPMTHKGCVTAKNLADNGWATPRREKCSTVTVVKSTGSDAEVQEQGCEEGHGVTSDMHLKIHLLDSEHVTGSVDLTMNGVGANGLTLQSHTDITGKWIGATCPADTD